MKSFINRIIPKNHLHQYVDKGWKIADEKEKTYLIQRPLANNRDDLIVILIRQKYSLNEELAILRQRDTKPEEYQEYFDYVEECKSQATLALDQNTGEFIEEAIDQIEGEELP